MSPNTSSSDTMMSPRCRPMRKAWRRSAGSADIALEHAALQLDRRAHRLDGAGEFHQHAVAHRLDDAAMEALDHRADQLGEMRTQIVEGPLLVGAHQAAVAVDVGEHDGRQTTIGARARHRDGCQPRGGALRGRPGGKTRDVIVEHLLALEAGRAEHHRPADLRAEIDVGGAERLAEQIGTIGERLLERRHNIVVAAPADGGLPLDLRPLHHLVDQRRLEAAGAEEQPAIIGAAQGILGLGGEAGLGKIVGDVGDDRRGLGHHDAAMHDGRQLAHRIDRQERRRLVLALLEIDRHDAVGRAGLLEHPVHHLRPRARVVIEDDLFRHDRRFLEGRERRLLTPTRRGCQVARSTSIAAAHERRSAAVPA